MNMVETVNGTMSFKDAAGDMKINTAKLFELIRLVPSDDRNGEYAFHGKKYMDKRDGDMHVGLNHPKKPTKCLKRSIMLRFRYTVDPTAVDVTKRFHFATITIFERNTIGFAGCKGYGDETLALRDQLKAALSEYAGETFTPPERFERDVPITVNNSTFYVQQKIVIIEQFMNFLREAAYEEISGYFISTRGLRICFEDEGTLIILVSGKNKVFGAKSEESMNRINDFVLKMYDDYDGYIDRLEPADD